MIHDVQVGRCTTCPFNCNRHRGKSDDVLCEHPEFAGNAWDVPEGAGEMPKGCPLVAGPVLVRITGAALKRHIYPEPARGCDHKLYVGQCIRCGWKPTAEDLKKRVPE